MPVDSQKARAQRDAVDEAMAVLDLDTKCRLLAGQDMWSLPAIDEIGLESIVMSDGPVGVRGRHWSGDPAVALPSPTAQAASWDPELAALSGRLLAAEARRKGVHVLLAPTVNLHRSPLGGRHFEAFSEDPLLTGVMAAEFVRGVQSGGVATTVKHFVANDAETDRFTVDNVVDSHALRELYLAPFAAVIAAGGWGVMSAYNRVNGQSMTENAELQQRVLREEWGFDGVIVSDWTASRDTVASALGGTDIAMPGPATVYGEALAAAVRDGRVDAEVVDARVRAVLLLAARVGALRGAPPAVPEAELPATPEGAAHAREVARRSFVLVKNDRDLLPLKDIDRVAVIGLPAKQARVMGGGSAQVFPPHIVSPLEGLQAALPSSTTIDYVPALDPRTKLPPVRDGLELRIIARDADGEVLYEADSPEGQVAWIGAVPSEVDFNRLHSVEITGELTSTQVGRHEFSVAGAGRFTLAIDGNALFDGTIPPGGEDPVAAFMSPPERRVVIDLAADIAFTVSLTHIVTPSPQAPFPLVAFRLGHSEPLPDPDEGIAAARAAAEKADVAIVFVTTTEDVESEGFDRTSLNLPGRQDELVAAVAEANPDTVVVVTAGAPVELPWSQDVAAVLLTWFGGQEFGAALADVLTGIAEPGGRLPTTWPRRLDDAPVRQVTPTEGALHYDEGRFIGYRAWQRVDPEPAWWFGHGLGYTDWEYEDLAFHESPDDDLLGTAEVTLRNRGERDGREVVQVYLEPADNADQPARRLAGFATVTAAPGERVTARVALAAVAVRFWDEDTRQWKNPEGRYRIVVGRSVADERLTAPLNP